MVCNTDIKKKLEDLKTGKLTCLKNTRDFLANIKKKNSKYNIFLQTNEKAKEIAKKLDEKRKKEEKLGSLFGLCIAIKSNISKKDMFISCASKTLENYRGSFDADVVRAIEEEDGIIIGVTNNDEFASGSSGENSAFGNTDNPFSKGRVPGGSSSGSAAAVSLNLCDIALGSDTGGSIRNPASHCAVTGIKPSYGRVSRYGLVDLSMSLDQIGPLSQDLCGCELMMEVIAKKSLNDPITEDIKTPKYTECRLKKKYRIGVIKVFESFIKDERIKQIYLDKINALKSKGHEIIELEIKNIDLAIQAYYPIVYTEFFSGTRKFDGIKYGEKIEDSGGDEVKRRIFGGMEISKSEFDGAYYKKALRVKEVIASEFKKAFKKVDFILSPVTPSIPHKLGSDITVEQMYAYDAFTIPANLAGICAGVICRDTIDENGERISIGTQILANKFREEVMFEGLHLLKGL